MKLLEKDAKIVLNTNIVHGDVWCLENGIIFCVNDKYCVYALDAFVSNLWMIQLGRFGPVDQLLGFEADATLSDYYGWN